VDERVVFERRYRLVYVSPEFVFGLVREGERGRFRVDRGLPPDAVFVSAGMDNEFHRNFYIVAASATYEPVPWGMQIPVEDVILTSEAE
jgi:hypothetical protein